MAGSPPPGFNGPPYPTRMRHPAGDGTPYIPMSYKGYDPGFNFPAPPSPVPVQGFSSGLTFSPTGYPLNPVNTCDPEDFGPSPVPFQVPESFRYPSAPPPPGFIYNPSLLSYPPEPAPAPEPPTPEEAEEEGHESDDDEKHNCYHWVPASASNCNFPGAIVVGHDQDGSPIYAGRAYHQGDLLPAKVIPSKTVAYIAYDSQEIVKDQFEVMVQKFISWQPASNGNVPDGAIEVGHTADGEVLYLGRVHREGALTPGKIQRSHGCCYFPFDGEEKNSTDYEVLVQQ